MGSNPVLARNFVEITSSADWGSVSSEAAQVMEESLQSSARWACLSSSIDDWRHSSSIDDELVINLLKKFFAI